MNRLPAAVAFRFALLLACFGGAAILRADWQPPVPLETLRAARAALIPFPREATWQQADWRPAAGVTIRYPREHAAALAPAAEVLRQAFDAQGLDPRVDADDGPAPAASGDVRLALRSDAAPGAEGYRLSVAAAGVTLEGVDAAGAFYGAQTLRQMLRPGPDGARVQTGEIRDWPAFRLRGFMHDVGRNFQEFESLKAQLDRFAAYKLNVFHWHLTDNPGWRLESKAFPALNDPQFQTRDHGKFYTYAQVRELVAYARARHITVIVELDMPGHSDCFTRAFGFKMGTPPGMEVLEKIVEEFCREIPAADRPWLHIGSDEVQIDQPQQFMARMLGVVQRHGSRPMVWNPGLPGDARTVSQFWKDDGDVEEFAVAARSGAAFVDSTGGYINSFDPLLLVYRQFIHQLCGRPAGDAQALGGILCHWPDVRVADKADVFRHSAVWPGVLAFAESAWLGRPGALATSRSVLPAAGSAAAESFAEFEDRLAAHRDRFFGGVAFPFVKFSRIPWRVVGPFARGPEEPGEVSFEPERKIAPAYDDRGATRAWQEAWGGTVVLASFRGNEGVYRQRPRATAYALTWVHTDAPRTIRAWIGFETARRSMRMAGGIPPAGQWDAFGANVWINEVPLPAPRWARPGAYRYLQPTWKTPANEEPFTDEEFYWTREPAEVPLRAGWNQVLLRVPCGYEGQNWSFTFLPVKRDDTAGRWIEDESLVFASPAGSPVPAASR